MAKEMIVRSITEPSMILDDLVFTDTEAGTSKELGAPETASKPSKQFGSVFPLIQINGFLFQPRQIVNLKLSSSGKRPYLTVEFLVTDKSFYSTSFPKDGDLLSLFIRGKVEPFKPIRNDYEITNVNVSSTTSNENSYDTMTVHGVLKIPGFDAVKCFSIKGSSYDAIAKVATNLKLGFASNELSTADTQTWICPNEKTRDFLDEVTLSAWKDDDSFFSYFIDHYYFLNFVNIEPLYSGQLKIEDAIAILRVSNDHGKDSVLHTNLTKTVLTNWSEMDQTQFFLSNYSLINNSSSISLRHGYKRYSQYYDSLLKENQSFFVDPKTTEGAEKEKQLLKGRPDENFYLDQINTKWMGVQYGQDGENCHAKYNYAKINNFQNNVHLDKMGLKVTMPAPNFNLRRAQTVPVVIMIQRDTVRKTLNEPVDEEQEKSTPNANEPNRTNPILTAETTPFLIDKTLSGNYVIDSIDYIYEQGKFSQECILLRREWPTPPQTR